MVPGGHLWQHGVEAPDIAGALAALEGVPRSLTQPERTIIVRRYGIDVRQPKKLADVAEEFGLSRERVCQLQRRAKDSLRAGMRAKTWARPLASEPGSASRL